MTDAESLYHTIAGNIPEAAPGQMFGKPCYKTGTRAFVCFFQDEMVFKLTGATHKTALALEGAQCFDPSGKGRPMKEWIQVPYAHSGHWQGFALDALAGAKASRLNKQ